MDSFLVEQVSKHASDVDYIPKGSTIDKEAVLFTFYYFASMIILKNCIQNYLLMKGIEMAEAKAKPGGKMLRAIVDLLCNIPLFDRLNVTELSVIAKYMNLIEADAGEYVFKEGDRGDYVCFIVNGSLEVLKKSETGTSVVIATLNRGRSIGEMSIIDDFPRSATVRVCAKVTLVTLTRNGFNLILEEYSKIGVKILKAIARLLSQNLRRTSSCLADYMHPID